jgi:hypothetical protein
MLAVFFASQDARATEHKKTSDCSWFFYGDRKREDFNSAYS